jgi:hypothetical protein
MGVNIYVKKLPGYSNHPDWDSSRFSGDKDFAFMLPKLPCETRNISSYPDFELYHRPSDFPAWRDAIAEWDQPNPGRFEHMMEILERDQDYWIYLDW